MKRVKFWAPAVVWMLAIFILSSRPSLRVSDQTVVNFLFFKSLHLVEYGVLYILLFRALRNTLPHRRMSFWAKSAFVLTVAYAISDEVHQRFVPTREGRPRDVIIDAIGAGVVWYLIVELLPKAPEKLRSLAKRLDIS